MPLNSCIRHVNHVSKLYTDQDPRGTSRLKALLDQPFSSIAPCSQLFSCAVTLIPSSAFLVGNIVAPVRLRLSRALPQESRRHAPIPNRFVFACAECVRPR